TRGSATSQARPRSRAVRPVAAGQREKIVSFHEYGFDCGPGGMALNDNHTALARRTSGAGIGSKSRRRRKSRRRNHMLIASWMNTDATERYQIQWSWNPGDFDSITAGIAMSPIRTADAISDGMVLPIAWKVLEATKISPDATKFQEMMCRYSVAIAMTAGSFVNTLTMARDATLHRIA